MSMSKYASRADYWKAKYEEARGLLRQCRPIVHRSIELSVNVYPAQVMLLVQIDAVVGEETTE